jgi:Rieske [2Fe-2S] domain
MLSNEENELLTRVAPGTAAGEMLRRYWWPVAFSEEVRLKGAPVKVRLLGEDFVLFRTGGGELGLLELHCSHRGTSLEFGRVETTEFGAAITVGSMTGAASVWNSLPSRKRALLRTGFSTRLIMPGRRAVWCLPTLVRSRRRCYPAMTYWFVTTAAAWSAGVKSFVTGCSALRIPPMARTPSRSMPRAIRIWR